MTTYVTFPDEFVSIGYPGYFLNLEDDQLYTMKVTGVLRPLKFQSKPYFFTLLSGKVIELLPGYSISVNGKRKRITKDDLIKIKMELKQTEIPRV